jgi:hypothetical protein
MTWMQGLSVTFGAVLILGAGLSAWGASRWATQTEALMNRLEAAREPAVVARFDARELDGLPLPVQRYFRTVLKDGQPIVAAVSVQHTGTFNLSETGEQWKPFRSEQRVITRRPGFLWNARISMIPGLDVRVHDAYVAGEGILHPTVMGLFTLTDLRGTREVAQGELMRFFAETAWYPTALLPSQGVTWSAVDDQTANATLADGPLRLTLRFGFSATSVIESVRAEGRGRTVGKTVVMTPWEGRYSDYREHEGMRVPHSGEVAWLTPLGRRPYWRGTITSATYEFAK